MDDEVGLQKLVRRHAERRGIEVLEAVTGEAGFEEAILEQPDIILLDVHLPDMNGVALLARLKRDPRTANIPVVAWSGSDAVAGEREMLAAGASAYLEKTDMSRVFERIAELLAPR